MNTSPRSEACITDHTQQQLYKEGQLAGGECLPTFSLLRCTGGSTCSSGDWQIQKEGGKEGRGGGGRRRERDPGGKEGMDGRGSGRGGGGWMGGIIWDAACGHNVLLTA